MAEISSLKALLESHQRNDKRKYLLQTAGAEDTLTYRSLGSSKKDTRLSEGHVQKL